MSLFIQSSGAISPQNSFDTDLSSAEIKEFVGNLMTVQEPEYEGWIDPRAIRRMSKIIRIGVGASLKALRNANLDTPDGIITGTSYGCLADTETFLRKMIENKEEALNPTPFIQSTHNTISGQIALLLKCYGYNQTFTQRGFSFENTLQDAQLFLNDFPDKKLLVGGADEVIDVSHRILEKFDFYRKNTVSNLQLYSVPKDGTINGEGAAYFVISGKSTSRDMAKIQDMKTMYKPAEIDVQIGLEKFLERNSLNKEDIDTLLLGFSGDKRHDVIYEKIETMFPHAASLYYKHLCGEYPTSSSFALWVATRIFHEEKIPLYMTRQIVNYSKPRNLLIYNHYFGIYHSLILVQN